MRKLIFLILPFFLLVGCTQNLQNTAESCKLFYFENDSDEKLVSVTENIVTDTPEAMVENIYSMLTTTEDKSLSPVITANIKLQEATISGGTCTLTLSKGYLNTQEPLKTAINTCLTKTICSLPFVDRVVISCEGIATTYEESDFITDAPRTYYDTYTVNLYFANETAGKLQADREIISLPPDTTLEHAVASRLLRGPTSDTLRSTIPAGTHLNNIYVSEGVCIIDLSADFVTNALHDELNEAITLYSVVNTITELPMIDSVKFLIDGAEGYGYTYHDISKALTNDSSLFNKK